MVHEQSVQRPRAFNFAQRGTRTAQGHVGVPRVHHQRVVDDEHMSILPLNSDIKSATGRTDNRSWEHPRRRPTPRHPCCEHRPQPITFTKTELRDCKSSGSRQQKVAVSTSSFIAALNSSYHIRVRELSETVPKESDPCEIRLLARLPPITSQLAVVKSAAPVPTPSWLSKPASQD